MISITPRHAARCLSHVQLFATPWTVAHQAPLFMGFSRQEHWSGLPCPPPGDLPHPRIKPRSSSLQAASLPLAPPPGLHAPFTPDLHIQLSTVIGLAIWVSPIAQSVKNLPAMQETWVRSLGREDPLEKEMATYSSILAWKIPWTGSW